MPRSAPEAFADCHACGARLRVEDHYYLETQTDEATHEGCGSVEFEASLELRWIHIPCPNCEEPEPISSLRHTWRQAAVTFGFGLGVFALLGAIAWQMLR